MLEAMDGHSTWYRKDDIVLDQEAPTDKAATTGMVLAQKDELSGQLHLLLHNIMTNASMYSCSLVQTSGHYFE